MLVSFREHNSEYNSEHKLFATPHAIYMCGMTSLFSVFIYKVQMGNDIIPQLNEGYILFTS